MEVVKGNKFLGEKRNNDSLRESPKRFRVFKFKTSSREISSPEPLLSPKRMRQSNDDDNNIARALLLQNEGDAYFNRREYDQAHHCFLSSLHLHFSPSCFHSLCTLLFLFHQSDQVICYCEQLLGSDPSIDCLYSSAKLNLGLFPTQPQHVEQYRVLEALHREISRRISQYHDVSILIEQALQISPECKPLQLLQLQHGFSSISLRFRNFPSADPLDFFYLLFDELLFAESLPFFTYSVSHKESSDYKSIQLLAQLKRNEEYHELEKLLPTHRPGLQSNWKLFQARIAQREGDFTRVRIWCQEALEWNSENEEARLLLARSLISLNLLTQAEVELNRITATTTGCTKELQELFDLLKTMKAKTCEVPPPAKTTYYSLLELERNCSTEMIRKAYKRLALKYHPDKNGGSSELFLRLSEAYEVLIHAEKRRSYDVTLPL